MSSSFMPNVITTGHDGSGQSVFIDSPASKQVGDNIGVLYNVLADGAVDLNGNRDLEHFQDFNPMTAGLIPKSGSAVLVARWPPSTDSSANTHRTLSVDVCVLTEGELECHLDSGEERTIRKGDVLIQRGTKHHWVNPSSTLEAVALCFVLPSQPVDGAEE